MWIDTHAHLDDDRFADDLAEALQRAQSAGVTQALTIGIDRPTSEAAVALARHHEMLSAVVGIQPNQLSDTQPGDWEAVLALVDEPKVVAIGETGLDRYWDRAPFPLQEEFFRKHLQLARRLNKPVVIHCREAEADTVRVLREEFADGPVAGVMHSFSGDWETAKACLDLGLHISFAGMLTYKSAANLREVARQVPRDRLLVETDSPYLAPVPKRGQRNEPGYVVYTGNCLAELHGIPSHDMARISSENACRLFGLG